MATNKFGEDLYEVLMKHFGNDGDDADGVIRNRVMTIAEQTTVLKAPNLFISVNGEDEFGTSHNVSVNLQL